MNNWHSLFSIHSALVFVFVVLCDAAWGVYVRRTSEGKAFASANAALAILLFGVFNTLSWLENRWMLVPLFTGSWIGTYLVVWWDHRRDGKK